MKITIHRALAEIKLINKKLEGLISQINPVATVQKDKLIGGYIIKEDFESKAKSDFDSYISLSKRRAAIKLAIIKSNAITMVDVGKLKMTVADAIIEKTFISDKVSFIARLNKIYLNTTSELERNNTRVEENLQRLIEVTFGSDKSKVKEDDYKSIANPFNEKNQFYLVDPLRIKDKIDELTKDVEEFTSNIDSALSESNATTLVEIPD